MKKLDSRHWILIAVSSVLACLLLVAGAGLAITGPIAYGFAQALFGKDFLKPSYRIVTPTPDELAARKKRSLEDLRGHRGAGFNSSLEFLASQSTPEALEILLRDANSNDAKIRELAAKLLTFYSNDDRALEALLSLESDSNQFVSYWAGKSINDGPEATGADKASRLDAIKKRRHLTQ